MKGADQSNSGQGAQTVYRDKKGRKLDMLNEFMKSQDARAGKQVCTVDRSANGVAGWWVWSLSTFYFYAMFWKCGHERGDRNGLQQRLSTPPHPAGEGIPPAVENWV